MSNFSGFNSDIYYLAHYFTTNFLFYSDLISEITFYQFFCLIFYWGGEHVTASLLHISPLSPRRPS